MDLQLGMTLYGFENIVEERENASNWHNSHFPQGFQQYLRHLVLNDSNYDK